MIEPDIQTVIGLSREYKTVPVYSSASVGDKTPADVFLILKNVGKQCFILESAARGGSGRYTFLGYDPKGGIECLNGEITVWDGGGQTRFNGNPAEAIRRLTEDNKGPVMPGLPPFCGGLVGYFSYDYIKYSEPTLNLDARDEENFKDADLMLFDKIAAFDHEEGRIYLIVNVKTDDAEANYNKACAELEHLSRLIERGERAQPQRLRLLSEFERLFDKERYCGMVEAAKAHIREGDIFQVVLSNRFSARAEGSLFDTYTALRQSNPSPYMFYFSSGDIEIAGASPETLVKLQDGGLFTFPLAGTRPRGRNAEEDAHLEEELLNDPKELAEHNMLVDLGRNDLGKISEFNSVRVDKYLSVLRFSHVMHLGSTVTGTPRTGCGALEAIDAVLPAGTLSGAPKIRACRIINELENNKRGIYGGALGYIGFSGNMDMCIAIRIAFKKNGKVFIRSGAGIVADSVPEREFAECEHKARAVLDALKRSSADGEAERL
jgi:anthranilate synthase component 1